jgi:HSP20 family protein
MNLDHLFPTLRSRSTNPDVFRDLRSEVSRVFDDFNKVFPMSENLDLASGDNGYLRPKIDVKETDASIDIVVDVPGVSDSDLDVQVEGKTLILKGKRSTENREDNDEYKIVERSYGSFMRSITLPFEPDADDIDGKLDSGVLTLTIQKPKETVEKVKTVKITRADDAPPPSPEKASAKAADASGGKSAYKSKSDTASAV